jgi:hypothetical protein
MLKGLGIGAAVAWSAPVLSSLGTPAFAAPEVSAGKLCLRAAKQTGQATCWVCPASNSPCGSTGQCLCFTNVKGCCSCSNDFFCGDTGNCVNKGDCPAGYDCGPTCCADGNDCLPPCSGARPDYRRRGRYASGKVV